ESLAGGTEGVRQTQRARDHSSFGRRRLPRFFASQSASQGRRRCSGRAWVRSGGESNPEPTKKLARPKQGVYFRDDSGLLKVETPGAVAAALCAGAKKPLLVTFNVYNSSAWLAAE